jgi:hypothetical protein
MIIRVAFVTLVAGLLLTACSDDSSPGPASPDVDAGVDAADGSSTPEASMEAAVDSADGSTPEASMDAAVGDADASSMPETSTDGDAGRLTVFDVVETFREPMTQPNDTIFTGTFTFDETNKTVSNLTGSLTESMTKVDGGFGGPMTTVELTHQLSAVPIVLDGVNGLLVTTFALDTADTFTGGGFAPGGTQYYGLNENTPNNHNAYAMIFVNLTDPTSKPTQPQLDKLAYADCTTGGMMMSSCMTGTTVAGYGKKGTMGGYPVSMVITRR